MSKCRYNLSEDCHDKDCLDCVLDKIRAEINGAKMPKNQMSFFRDGINCALEIIDKYKAESEENNGNG